MTIRDEMEKVIADWYLDDKYQNFDIAADAILAMPAIKQLVDGVIKVVDSSVQETSGPYASKNNKCVHGNYGYDGCGDCIEEFLRPLIAPFKAGA